MNCNILSTALMALTVVTGPATVYAMDVNFVSTSGNVEFRATGHPAALHVAGKGPGAQGKFVVNQEDVTGSASFDLANLDTGISLRDEHMKEKYLEVPKFPRAELTNMHLKLPHPMSATFPAATGVPFQGTLKLHGVEKPVSGTADLKLLGGMLQTDAQFSLKLSDYGIQIPAYMGITIADQVQIDVKATSAIAQ